MALKKRDLTSAAAGAAAGAYAAKKAPQLAKNARYARNLKGPMGPAMAGQARKEARLKQAGPEGDFYRGQEASVRASKKVVGKTIRQYTSPPSNPAENVVEHQAGVEMASDALKRKAPKIAAKAADQNYKATKVRRPGAQERLERMNRSRSQRIENEINNLFGPDEPSPVKSVGKAVGRAGETLGAVGSVLGVAADLKEADKNAYVGKKSGIVGGPLGGPISRDFGSKARKRKA